MSTHRNGRGLPAYQQIQRVIREQIEGKQLKSGEAVNSERELARIHGVSLMTARHALAGLEREESLSVVPAQAHSLLRWVLSLRTAFTVHSTATLVIEPSEPTSYLLCA